MKQIRPDGFRGGFIFLRIYFESVYILNIYFDENRPKNCRKKVATVYFSKKMFINRHISQRRREKLLQNVAFFIEIW